MPPYEVGGYRPAFALYVHLGKSFILYIIDLYAVKCSEA